MKESTRVLVAVALAIVIGLAIAASGSASLAGIADSIAPIGALWVNAIRMTVIPLVVALLVTGIAASAEAAHATAFPPLTTNSTTRGAKFAARATRAFSTSA